jgi:uncharacterized protein YecT (DUF1311 family)
MFFLLATSRIIAAEASGDCAKSDLESQVQKYEQSWSPEMRSAVTKLRKVNEEFANKASALWVLTRGDDGQGYVLGARKTYFFDLIVDMERKPPTAEEAKKFKTVDDEMNIEYGNLLKQRKVDCENGCEQIRVAQRLWLKVRDQFAEVFRIRFKGKMSEDVLRKVALTRITKSRIEDIQTADR